MKISEIFYSLQGEGYRAGHPSIFIRLAACNLACDFCDTEFNSGKPMTDAELLETIKNFPARWIVWTGGEPLLQLKQSTVQFFRAAGYAQALETNGSKPIADINIDHIACSPKVADHVVAANFPTGVHELRYVRHIGQPGVPEPDLSKLKADHYYLSPMFDGDQVNEANLKHCIALCLEHPKWNLSLQSHKLTKVL